MLKLDRSARIYILIKLCFPLSHIPESNIMRRYVYPKSRYSHHLRKETTQRAPMYLLTCVFHFLSPVIETSEILCDICSAFYRKFRRFPPF